MVSKWCNSMHWFESQPNNLEMGDETVLFFYVAKEGTFYLDAAAEFDPQGDMSGIRGYSAVLGNFNIRYGTFVIHLNK